MSSKIVSAKKINAQSRKYSVIDFNPINLQPKVKKRKVIVDVKTIVDKNGEVKDVIEKQEQVRLTAKQYLVLNWLCCNSNWNTHYKGHVERHYYLYKDEFKIPEVAAELGISTKTFYNSIKKLIATDYISEESNNRPYYIIYFPKPYIPLETKYAKILIDFGAQMDNGGYLITILGIIFKYFAACKKKNKKCEISASQICQILKFDGTHKKEFISIQMCIGVLDALGFIDIKEKDNLGNRYITYVIRNTNSTPDIDEYKTTDITKILEDIDSE